MKYDPKPMTLDEKVEQLENLIKNYNIALERVKKQRDERKVIENE